MLSDNWRYCQTTSEQRLSRYVCFNSAKEKRNNNDRIKEKKRIKKNKWIIVIRYLSFTISLLWRNTVEHDVKIELNGTLIYLK